MVRGNTGRKLFVPARAEEVIERTEAVKHLAHYMSLIYTLGSRDELRRVLRMLRPERKQ